MKLAFDQSAINKLMRRHLSSLEHSVIYYDMPDGSRGGGMDPNRRKVHSIMERIHGLNADVISHNQISLFIVEIDPLSPQKFLDTGKFEDFARHEEEMLLKINSEFSLNLTDVRYIYAPIHKKQTIFDSDSLPVGPKCTSNCIDFLYLTGFDEGVATFTTVPCIES